MDEIHRFAQCSFIQATATEKNGGFSTWLARCLESGETLEITKDGAAVASLVPLRRGLSSREIGVRLAQWRPAPEAAEAVREALRAIRDDDERDLAH